MARKPFISVIIPLKQLSYYLIFESLPALAEQTYRKFEVIVLPNEQTQYDLTLLRRYKFLRIIPTGKIERPALKRDLGVEKAQGDIIAFIDDDAYPSPQWLEEAVKHFSRPKIAAVCGPGALPHMTDLWEKIFDEVLKTWIGSGVYTYRFTPKPKRYVDDYPSMNFLIRKKVFEKLGGFNNDYWPGEDSKLCNDIVYKEKLKILYHPKVLVYHHRRKDLKSYLKQHGSYGFHRGAFMAHGDENSRRISYLAPTAYYAYLILFFLFVIAYNLFAIPNIFFYIFSLPLFAYLAAVTYLLVRAFINTLSIKVSLGAAATLILTHLTYAMMFVKGFRKGLDKSKSIYDQG